ncbi:glutamate receptor 1-like [Chrysoperla carnea]|uniref:glutamate receptor 1-like n=1 Tax=Chrysoperla carnea TaxID=189513 RepID=UPI001D094FB2|nr:glutamate receptor 1-like [Chrysoperla carnea]
MEVFRSWILILIYYGLLPFNEAYENQMKIDFLKDYFKFEHNTRFILHVCFPIDLATKKELSLCNQFNNVKDPAYFINDNIDHRMIRVLDMDCPSANDILMEANSTLHFTFPNRWVLLFGKNTSDVNESLLLDIDSNVITAKIFSEELINLKQPYKYNRFETFLDAHVDSVGKVAYNVNKLLCSFVNATQRHKLTYSWGLQDSNGTWNKGSMIDRIRRREDEVNGMGMAIFPNRLPAVKYLAKTSDSRAGFIFRMPALSYVSNILRLSFQTKLWAGLGVLLLLMMVIMKYLFTFEVKRNRSRDKAYNVENCDLQKGWASLSVFLVGSLCQQGVEKEPVGISGRVGTFFVYLAMLFIYTSYSANIVALLQASASIGNVDEFMQSPIKAGFLDFELSRILFEKSSNPIRKKIYEEKAGPKSYYSYVKGVEKIRNGLFAFYGEPGIVFHYVSKTFEESEKCDLQEIPTPGEFSVLFHATPHKSPYIEIFKNGLLRIDETGLQEKWYLRYYKSQVKCGASVANFVQVGIRESYWAFIIWSFGVGAAILIVYLSTKKQLSLRNQYNDVKNSVYFINDNLDHRMIRVLDMDCSSANNILLQANSTLHFTLPNRWLLLFGKNTTDLSESLLLDIDSNVITAKIYNEKLIHLKQPYKYNRYETFLGNAYANTYNHR